MDLTNDGDRLTTRAIVDGQVGGMLGSAARQYTQLKDFYTGRTGLFHGDDANVAAQPLLKQYSNHNVFACVIDYSEPRPTKGTGSLSC